MRIASRAARMPRRVPVYSKAQWAHDSHSPSHGLQLIGTLVAVMEGARLGRAGHGRS